jgi:hypothetical protein
VRAEWKRAEAEGNSAERMLRFELERARVAAEQAEARYDSVDLENKLAKARLEKRLQEALAELKRLERRVRSGLASADPVFTDEAWTELLALSQNIAGILSAPTTEHRDRKELFRTLWDCAVLEKRDDKVIVTLRRADGGPDTSGDVKLMKYAYRMIAELSAKGLPAAEIARRLNEEGLRTHKHPTLV